MPIRSKWKPFRISEIRALLLNEPGVYEIGRAEGDKVLYIGKSDTSIRSRLLNHKEKTKFRACTHFRLQKTPPEDAQITEGNLLEAYKRKNGEYPLLNKNRSPKNELDDILHL